MYGMFTHIYHKNQRNVGKYTSPMDPMGYTPSSFPSSTSRCTIFPYLRLVACLSSFEWKIVSLISSLTKNTNQLPNQPWDLAKPTKMFPVNKGDFPYLLRDSFGGPKRSCFRSRFNLTKMTSNLRIPQPLKKWRHFWGPKKHPCVIQVNLHTKPTIGPGPTGDS